MAQKQVEDSFRDKLTKCFDEDDTCRRFEPNALGWANNCNIIAYSIGVFYSPKSSTLKFEEFKELEMFDKGKVAGELESDGHLDATITFPDKYYNPEIPGNVCYDYELVSEAYRVIDNLITDLELDEEMNSDPVYLYGIHPTGPILFKAELWDLKPASLEDYNDGEIDTSDLDDSERETIWILIAPRIIKKTSNGGSP